MGRRKIEIQPITRKNGLFKKAYELGVLCSVDVAVIIFGQSSLLWLVLHYNLFDSQSPTEERAGHHLKLYQYCSGDIHDIVQRHIRYEGEKDTRTPHDFTNNANAKLDDGGDDDDGDADDDDPDTVPGRTAAKKRGDTKIKPEYGSSNGKVLVPHAGGDMGLNVDVNDYRVQQPMTIPPPPMPLHHSSQLQSAGGGASLPISTERHSSSAPNVSAGSNPKLPAEDSVYNGYLPSPTSAHTPGTYRHNGQPSHQLPYNSYLASMSSPSQNFLPSSSFDLPPSARGAPMSRNGGYNQRSSTYPQPQDPQLQGIYHQLLRHNLPPDHEDHRPPPSQPSQFAPLDWPTHGPSQQTPQATQPPQQESGPSGDTSWLEFLSHNPPQPSGQQLHMTLPPVNPRDGLSWERDREIDHYNLSERGGGGDKGVVNGMAHVSPQSRKRPRTDSGVHEGRRPSPTARGVTGIVKDRVDPSNNTMGQSGKEERE
ncbi:hypothetical protein PAXRUDRAFT_563586 [Paxillus rubicundulus Ve08.2h10]|uniref:MADS-box domain-containing protein n=1 Tax=Paxillus rubicundulus Ve08.2h10 TaxID=930991 RepID=A0A0D0E586_9AGAM|nr:hypothetical protein PAXRUDRAFT_563586 [Paxillus rubicundulus Ve08.2h10]